MGGLNLMSRQKAFGRSDRGNFITPGNPETSLVFTRTAQRHGKQEEVMPADGILLTDEQRQTLRRWIEEGAHWPDGKDGALVPLTVTPGNA